MTSPVTIIIIIITSVISVPAFQQRKLFDRMKFNAYDAHHSKQLYRFFSYGLIHAGWIHLFINMFVLYSFGEIVEVSFRYLFAGKGIFYYLLMYCGAIIISILPAYGKHRNDVFYSAVGASGAVSAIVFSSIILYPTGKMILLLVPIPLPAPLFGLLYVIYSAYMAKRGKDNIGHDAHLWGAIFGLVFTIALRPQLVVEFLEKVF
ncbi:MAG: rhomboid family intramembrane serine protease [Bacteroidetes bacterium]|nr:rhomboid family intramembrane serine protease [Bacteroidota bacterium]